MVNQGVTFEQFLQDEGIVLAEQELHKYRDWKNEDEINGSGWLGWGNPPIFSMSQK